MKTVYSVEIYEDGLRCDGFYEIKTAEDFFNLVRLYSESDRDVKINVRRHEIEHECDICGSGSIKEVYKLNMKCKGL